MTGFWPDHGDHGVIDRVIMSAERLEREGELTPARNPPIDACSNEFPVRRVRKIPIG